MSEERVVDLRIEEEIKESYLRYAMSVIVSRALPDVRDGLKPSQRRILVAMNDLNLGPRSRYTKCAAIVGETMKKYHPHGDQAIYPTLTRLAQDWTIRNALVDGQGNFGSIDGDPPAAMRYTEARMTSLATEMMADIKEDTVDFQPNYDESDDEPVVLPARFPNLLCNGSSGIAVGMSTSIPPHNLEEVCNALAHLLDHPDCTTDDLLEYVRGPDFPTGGIICGERTMRKAYRTGRGRITVRGKAEIEPGTRNKPEIHITEIPYQISKTNLIEKMAKLVRDGRIEGITDIRDYSDRHGMRIVVECKQGENAEIVLNAIYKHTELQTTFSIINIALVNGRPETLSLKRMLEEYRDHRVEVIRRRSAYRLDKARDRHHIVCGYIIALLDIDRVIEIIRSSAHAEEAEHRLRQEFRVPADFETTVEEGSQPGDPLSEAQAQAILSMQLRRLTSLEEQSLKEEKASLEETITDLKDILAREERVVALIKEDLEDLVRKFSDPRRTYIGAAVGDIGVEDLIPEENVVVTATHEGYIKATPVEAYRSQRRGGVGVMGARTKEGDFVEHIFVADTHDTLLFFTDLGRVYGLKVYEVPQAGRTARGRAAVNLIELGSEERVTNMIPVSAFDDSLLLFSTRDGRVKKSALEEYEYMPSNGKIALNLVDDDRLVQVKLTSGEDVVVLGTAQGYAIRFHEEEARAMGRATQGVRGIKLRDGDRVVDCALLREGGDLLTVCETGYGKRTPAEEYPTQHRGGMGVRNIKTEGRNGLVVGVKAVSDGDEIVLITKGAKIIRTRVDANLRPIGRNTMGVKLVRLQEGDQLVSCAVVPPEDEDEEEIEEIEEPSAE